MKPPVKPAMESNYASNFPVVSVKNLSVSRGNYLAVDSVSFEVFSGTNTAIIGPNGAGKSTLIKAILGLIPASSGEISILGCKGKSLKKLGQAIGYIPQKFPFDRNFPLTVAELVALAVQKRGFFGIKKSLKKQVEIALQQVNLQHHANQPIGTLSGGELKRVLLAYCLVIPRRLLILDEVFAGVDITGEAEFAALLAKLQQEQSWTILQVSHDLDLVSQYCHNVLCLNRHLVAEDAPSKIFTPENMFKIYGSFFKPSNNSHQPTRLGKFI